MKKKIRIGLYVLAAILALGGIQTPIWAGSQVETSPLSGETGVTVTTREEFMDALAQHKSPINVPNFIGIGEDVDTDNRMLPVKIPANTVIQGTENGSICSRSPIQLEGDGVVFRNIELTFESSDALWSVPHREIFLAGHSLTLDNVRTYLEGGGSGMGGLEGSEKELLPTVYAGGYSGTAVGGNASLSVVNSNAETMFQAIYMGHGEGNDHKVPYQGNAAAELDAKTIVREAVDTKQNSRAEITISGTGNTYAGVRRFDGGENTTLTLAGVSMESTAADAVRVENIGNIVLKDGSCLAPQTDYLYNVMLKNGSCLDFSNVKNAEIFGNFSGETGTTSQQGILVLNSEGSLIISGEITGTTRFQTENRLFPGTLLEKSYIFDMGGKGSGSEFVLARQYIERGYELQYAQNVWTVYGESAALREIGNIDISYAPKDVDLRAIVQKEDGSVPDENIYFEVTWYDKDGIPFSSDEITDEYWFFDGGYVVLIKSEYWKSNDSAVQNETIWSQPIWLLESKEHPARYYLEAQGQTVPGKYTFLFCSAYIEEDLITVADVKALKNTVMAECEVNFYSSDQEKPDVHVHDYRKILNSKPTCTKEGTMTYTCSCGKTYTEPVAALGHRPVTDPAVAPTETTPGKTEGSHCGVCGTVLKAQSVVPATGKPEGHKHVYQSSVTKKAACSETGIRTYTCGCGSKYTETIPALGHQYSQETVPATVKNAGKIRQVCRLCSGVKEEAVIDSPRKVVLSKSDYSYDGKVKKPSVTIKDSKGKPLAADTDYRVIYPKGRKTPGVYTVTVEFRGNYSGRMTGVFTIRPKKTSLKKVAAKSKGMQVTWKKQTAQIDGYQIQYGTSKNLTGKSVKTATAKKSATTQKISKLKGKKQYYVRVRTYKTVTVNGKKKKLYSDWSSKKAVRVKK